MPFLLLYSFEARKVPRSITSEDFVFNLKEVFLYLFLFTLQLCCHCPFTVLYCVKYIKVVKFTSS